MGLIAGNVFGLGAAVAPKACMLYEQAAQNTAGGTFTSGAWRTRVLTSMQGDTEGIVTIASNEFTLQPGKYLIMWSAPAFRVGPHQTRIYDVTVGTAQLGGSSEQSANTDNVQTRSIGSYIADIAAANAYRIEHRGTTTVTTNGFGVPTNFGAVEVYTIVTIIKLS